MEKSILTVTETGPGMRALRRSGSKGLPVALLWVPVPRPRPRPLSHHAHDLVGSVLTHVPKAEKP